MIPLVRAVTASTLACTRCGSADVHPLTGAVGPLVAVVGLMRYGCRGCRRSFWIRADADRRHGSAPSDRPEDTGAGSAGAPPPRPAAASLDFEVTPAKHETVDLTPLDAEFERIRTGGGTTERPRLGDSPPEATEAGDPGPAKAEPPAPGGGKTSPPGRRGRQRP